MASTRQLKFSRMLQKELADIFQKDQKSLFSGNIISVTHLEISPDFGVAHVQISLVLDKDREQMLEVLNANKGNIKRSLGKRIGKQARKIPDIFFHLDHGAEHAQNMDKLFKDLDVPPDEE